VHACRDTNHHGNVSCGIFFNRKLKVALYGEGAGANQFVHNKSRVMKT
jgi:hypothetical protein